MIVYPKISLRCLLAALFVSTIQGCTNILVTPGASEDGNPMIAYNADDYTLFGSLYHYPSSSNNQDSPHTKMRKCYSWDDGILQLYVCYVRIRYF
jgi:dipeptidase